MSEYFQWVGNGLHEKDRPGGVLFRPVQKDLLRLEESFSENKSRGVPRSSGDRKEEELIQNERRILGSSRPGICNQQILSDEEGPIKKQQQQQNTREKASLKHSWSKELAQVKHCFPYLCFSQSFNSEGSRRHKNNNPKVSSALVSRKRNSPVHESTASI